MPATEPGLGRDRQAVRLLRQTLDEEKQANLLLTEIGHGSVNEAAQMA